MSELYPGLEVMIMSVPHKYKEYNLQYQTGHITSDWNKNYKDSVPVKIMGRDNPKSAKGVFYFKHDDLISSFFAFEDNATGYADYSSCFPTTTSNNTTTEREVNNMFNFDFGVMSSNIARLSMHGVAVKNKQNRWVAYDAANGKTVDVTEFTFGDKLKLYKMPVATNQVQAGDCIMHNGKVVHVTKVLPTEIECIDCADSEFRVVLPTSNIFNFDYVTKIVNPFGGMMQAPTAENPFGNMLPFMLMNESGNSDAALMFMMMQNQNTGATNIFANPMMMYFMMKDSKELDPMLLMCMMNGQNNTCSCACHE